jgi:hypothetical protein
MTKTDLDDAARTLQERAVASSHLASALRNAVSAAEIYIARAREALPPAFADAWAARWRHRWIAEIQWVAGGMPATDPDDKCDDPGCDMHNGGGPEPRRFTPPPNPGETP